MSMEHSALLIFAIETVNTPSVHVFLGNFLGKRDLSSYKMPLRKNNALLGTCWHIKSITYLFLMTSYLHLNAKSRFNSPWARGLFSCYYANNKYNYY